MSTEEMMLRILQAYDPHTIYPNLDTPYSKRYANSNFAAFGQDVNTLRGILFERQEQIIIVNTIIERTETILAQLREKHEQIVASKKTHEVFLSHIRRLPSEILREIFLQCLPTEKHIRPVNRDAPLLLTRICRRWREVALDTPRLWCSLSATVRPRATRMPSWRRRHLRRSEGESSLEPEPEPETHLPFYEDWLKRAKFCPLSLTIDLSDSRVKSSQGWKNAAIDLFGRYTSRSRELHLSFDQPDCLASLLKDMPIVEHLYLNGDMGDLPTISIVQLKPCLHTFIVRSPTAFGIDVFSAFNLGWTNLTRLALMFDSKFDIRDNIFLVLLQRCPNLEHFVFPAARIPAHDDPVLFTHSKLQVLHLGTLEVHASTTDRLTLPKLHRLQAASYHLSDDNPFYATSMPKKPFLNESRSRRFYLTIPQISDPQRLVSLFNPGWRSITHLTMHISCGDIITQIFRLCRNLEDATIRIEHEASYHRGYLEPSSDPFTHYKLRSLRLRLVTGSFEKLLELFTLPKLSHLEITHLENLRWPHAQFKKFYSRSHFQLEKLIIEGMMMYNVDKSSFLKFIPTLKDVDIHKVVRHNETDSDSE